MGFGDLLHWTSIIRDIQNNINSKKTVKDKINEISKYQMKNNKYGIIRYKYENINFKFKIYLLTKKEYWNYKKDLIFKNNPYITDNLKYPNIIFLLIYTNDYYIDNKFLDNKHVVQRYCENMNIINYKINCELYFSEEENEKVKKYLPKKKFIFIEPNNFKIGREYPFDKFQKIVDTFKNDYLFVQISPSKFEFYIKKAKQLKNTIYYEDTFTYRETLLFMGYAELAIVNEGGLSIGSNVTGVKTICIYPALFKPIMTNYENVVPISIASKEHNSCGNIKNEIQNDVSIPLPCQECEKLFNSHDENIIIDKVKEILKY